MLDLEPIKARLAVATPGPWHVEPEDTACGSFVARMPGIYIEPEHQHLAPAGNDAALIANAPADIAALVAEVERLRTFIDKAVMPRYCEMFEELGLGDPTTSVVVEEAARLLRPPTALPGEGGAT